MKRTYGIFVAVIALLVAVPLAAQPPQGPGRGFGGRLGPGGPGGPGRGPAPLHALSLSEEQRQQVRAIHEEQREKRPDASLAELQKQLQAAIFADTPDLAKIEQLKTAIAAAEAALLAHRIDTELRVAQLLTAEQRARARELLANAPRPGAGHARARGARP
jgi:Spy/CpxP family protein refolding chaperone